MDDGFKHKVAGNVISLGVGAVTYELTDKPFLSVAVGFTSGVLISVLKEEVYDKRMKKGTHNKQDYYDGSWGSLVGSLMLVVYIDGRENRKDKIARIKTFD
jgi:hypothetical protein